MLGEIGDQQISAADFPSLFAWWALASKFTQAVRNSWPAATQQQVHPAKKDAKHKQEQAPKKEEPKKDEDFDPFAEEMDEEEKA